MARIKKKTVKKVPKKKKAIDLIPSNLVKNKPAKKPKKKPVGRKRK